MGTNDVPTVADGAEPPYDHEMDRRLTVLETRFDTLFPTLAMKSDLDALRSDIRAELEKLRGEFRTELEKLRADQLKMHNDFMKWIIGLVISLFIAVIGFDIAIFNAVNKALPAGLAPTATAEQHHVPVSP